MPLVQERAKILAEIVELTTFFFVDDLAYQPELLVVKKMDKLATIKALESSLQRIEALPDFSHQEPWRSCYGHWQKSSGLKPGSCLEP
jgi:hypothetical protein